MAPTESEDRDRIADEAGYWDARLRSPDCTDDDRARFARWRDADPAHRAAFEKLQTLVAMLQASRGRADVRGLREQVADASARRRRRFWRGTAAASVVAATLGLAMNTLPVSDWLDDVRREIGMRLSETRVFATGTAQTSSFVLQDGSSVELNARSRIRVAFTETQRRVELLEGQALFQVAKDPSRPFVVRAGNREIIAVGTAFDVRLDAETVRVTLIEGKVRVEQSEREEAVLTPGKQLIAALGPAAGASGTQASVRTIDVTQVTGWREGRIFLEDQTLAAAVAEMNRHSPVQLRIADPSIAGLRVNGMFRAGAQDTFVAALEAYFPIVAERRGADEIVLVPRR